MPDIFGFDCYSPKEVAERVENVGVSKANLPLLSMSALGVLAGGFIGLGGMFFTLDWVIYRRGSKAQPPPGVEAPQ
jgi:formate/nitrite transporter FocA (FNT family)